MIYISDVVPGAMPKITQENYSSSCRKTKRWKLVSRGKRDESLHKIYKMRTGLIMLILKIL